MFIHISVIRFTHCVITESLYYVTSILLTLLHIVAYPRCAFCEIECPQLLLEAIGIYHHLLIAYSHLYQAQVIWNIQFITILEIVLSSVFAYSVRSILIKIAGLEAFDTVNLHQSMIQLRFGIFLFWYGNTQVAHGSVIPIFGGKCCKTVLGLRLNFYRTGQVLHCGIEHLHQHIRSITSCFNLHIGTEKQVLRFINGHFTYILTQVAMLVEKTPHTLRNIRTFEER